MIKVLIWILTAILVLDSFLLVLLVLIQLPKKEAGAGMAFGGGATEALFGAGSGNAMTKITKYVATIFFILALLISVLYKQLAARQGSRAVEEQLSKQSSRPQMALPALVNSNPPAATFPATNAIPGTNAGK